MTALFGSLVKSQYNFDQLRPQYIGEAAAIDPRQRLTAEDVAEKRTNKKKIRKYGLYKDLTPGQELEIRGFNEFQGARRRSKRQMDALEAISEKRGLQEAIAKSREDADRTSDNVEAKLERKQRGLGLRLSERQQRSQTRQLGLARTLAREEASGATRRGFGARAEALGRQAGGFENALYNTESAGLTQLSRAAAESKAEDDKAIAKREKDRMKTLGGIVGMIGGMF